MHKTARFLKPHLVQVQVQVVANRPFALKQAIRPVVGSNMIGPGTARGMASCIFPPAQYDVLFSRIAALVFISTSFNIMLFTNKSLGSISRR